MACTGHTNSCGGHAGYEPAVTPSTWTDTPLVAGSTTVKTAHHNELRNAIAAEISRWGASWTDPGTVTSSTTISYLHVRRLRDGINAAQTWSWPSHLNDANTGPDDDAEAQQYNAMRDQVNTIQAICACDCNYACTCNCNYACTCDCDYACTCNCNYACTCNCNNEPVCGCTK